MTDVDTVIDWLVDVECSDPSIRWQVMRDLLDAPPVGLEDGAGQGGDRRLGCSCPLFGGRGWAVGGRSVLPR